MVNDRDEVWGKDTTKRYSCRAHELSVACELELKAQDDSSAQATL
jgi:hypothetical protein